MSIDKERERVKKQAKEVEAEYNKRVKEKSEKNKARCKQYREEYKENVKESTKKRKEKMKINSRRSYLLHRDEILKKKKAERQKQKDKKEG